MRVGNLTLPVRLVALIEAGVWPRTLDETNRQNCHPLASTDLVRRLVPAESTIFFWPPPFSTIAKVVADPGETFYRKYGALQQIQPAACIGIGDFGLGSDSPILLDYSRNPTAPRMLWLKWSAHDGPNEWVEMAATFDEFADRLQLGAGRSVRPQ